MTTSLFSRREAFIRLAALGAIAMAPSVRAEAPYPAKAVKIVLPYSPGGITDVTTRLLAQHLSVRMGKSVIVENRPGANGIIGTSEVVRSPADGYTLLSVPVAFVVNPHLQAQLTYDPLGDMTGVSLIGRIPMTLGISGTLPAKNLEEFIAWGKAQKEPIPFATNGIGGGSHLGALLFAKAVGLNVTSIPYKGMAAAIPDLASGQVAFAIDGVQSFAPHLGSERIRAVAITGTTRSPGIPYVPTFAEAGLEEFNSSSWLGFLAPKQTPASIVNQLSAHLDAVINSPEVFSNLQAFGLDPVGGDAESFNVFLRSESEKWGSVIREFAVKPV